MSNLKIPNSLSERKKSRVSIRNLENHFRLTNGCYYSVGEQQDFGEKVGATSWIKELGKAQAFFEANFSGLCIGRHSYALALW